MVVIPAGPSMYADPQLIRANVVKISLNDLEDDLIQAWVNYRGGQKAVLLREMLLEQARLDLGIDPAANHAVNESPQLKLLSY